MTSRNASPPEGRLGFRNTRIADRILRRLQGGVLALLVFLTASAAHADAPLGGYRDPPQDWILTGAALAFLFLIVGSFFFIVTPPREP